MWLVATVTPWHFAHDFSLWHVEHMSPDDAARAFYGGVLGLPMIVNRKTVDPNDASSPGVVQLETAMGAAIEVTLIRRLRHAPVLAIVVVFVALLVILHSLAGWLFGYAIRTEVRHLPTVVLDESRTAQSRALVAALVYSFVRSMTTVSAVIFLFGAEVTAAYARLRRHRPEEIPAAPSPRV